MKPIEVNSDSYLQYNEDSNKKDPKFKVGYHVRISKYKNIFAKGYTPNWSKEIFVISRVKRTYVIIDFNGKEIVRSFYEKEFQKTSQNEFRIHSYQVSRIDRQAHGFGRFFRLSPELGKNQGFSRNQDFSSR